MWLSALNIEQGKPRGEAHLIGQVARFEFASLELSETVTLATEGEHWGEFRASNKEIVRTAGEAGVVDFASKVRNITSISFNKLSCTCMRQT